MGSPIHSSEGLFNPFFGSSSKQYLLPSSVGKSIQVVTGVISGLGVARRGGESGTSVWAQGDCGFVRGCGKVGAPAARSCRAASTNHGGEGSPAENRERGAPASLHRAPGARQLFHRVSHTSSSQRRSGSSRGRRQWVGMGSSGRISERVRGGRGPAGEPRANRGWDALTGAGQCNPACTWRKAASRDASVFKRCSTFRHACRTVA